MSELAALYALRPEGTRLEEQACDVNLEAAQHAAMANLVEAARNYVRCSFRTPEWEACYAALVEAVEAYEAGL